MTQRKIIIGQDDEPFNFNGYGWGVSIHKESKKDALQFVVEVYVYIKETREEENYQEIYSFRSSVLERAQKFLKEVFDKLHEFETNNERLFDTKEIFDPLCSQEAFEDKNSPLQAV